ncbi:hypothetical protein GNI_087310 [Gregarina niphandrodes]|uniref:Uncharacterized protein n=1 Tax=Gregarina niphandrodes TaxID=110365 RepID=A0A023B5U2_GRENI|nr:hypothetical protein GNI_087310 [Gregarina niphandrodes]EZG62962.1 hypothetical protein GNI_087310 [Gregarina niphandrodes]|eukprot:XP_011130700.1 hypothetical protein GNI_087310 [Gregarina niphandrodes]
MPPSVNRQQSQALSEGLGKRSDAGGQTDTSYTKPKTYAQKVNYGLWENSIGPGWQKYRKSFKIFPYVVFKDPKIERLYAQYVKETYQLRNIIAGLSSISKGHCHVSDPVCLTPCVYPRVFNPVCLTPCV